MEFDLTWRHTAMVSSSVASSAGAFRKTPHVTKSNLEMAARRSGAPPARSAAPICHVAVFGVASGAIPPPPVPAPPVPEPPVPPPEPPVLLAVLEPPVTLPPVPLPPVLVELEPVGLGADEQASVMSGNVRR